MRQQVENGRCEGTYPTCKHHESKLADCGKSQDPLDIRLGERDRRGKERGGSTHDCDTCKNGRGKDKHRAEANNEIDAGIDHRGCVDQGRHWSWSFHRGWKPGMKWELS